jgi:two-component system copper resistance phosphate regulon response regulator CusR
MERMDILLISEDLHQSNLVQKAIVENNCDAHFYFHSCTNFKKSFEVTFDLILVADLFNKNIAQLCQDALNYNPQSSIIIFTEEYTLLSKIEALEMGVQYFLKKTTDLRELLATIKLIIRRRPFQYKKDMSYKIANLELKVNSRIAERGGKQVILTAKEFLLLEYLFRNKGRVVSHAELADKVWNIRFETKTNFIPVHINFLRNKIDKEYSEKLIHTVVKFGYVLKESNLNNALK